MNTGAFRAVQIACALGLVHAAFSLYWALGGRWLLDTVGQGAVDLARQQPQTAFWLLLAVALFKGAAAIIPLLNAQGQMPWPGLWRGMSWVGSVFLILYGGVFAITAGLVLTGVINPAGDIDRMGMVGHALLWDPLFLLWGVFLLAHLWLTRRNS